MTKDIRNHLLLHTVALNVNSHTKTKAVRNTSTKAIRKITSFTCIAQLLQRMNANNKLRYSFNDLYVRTDFFE